MNSFSFPDVNVWLALLLADHVHRDAARRWWNGDDSEILAFTRITQISVLRLLSTAAAMNGRPLTMKAAWKACDRLFEDDRVAVLAEPPDFEPVFRRFSSAATVSPKVWADACLLAFAVQCNGKVVTFDRALANRGADCLVLE